MRTLILASALSLLSTSSIASESICIRPEPAGGYAFAQVSAGPSPTASQLAAAEERIAAYLAKVREVPAAERRGSEPECYFHAPGRPILGTVILFHGFNAEPVQQGKLAAYLFHQGFNVYNAHLVDHQWVTGSAHWPKTVYKPEFLSTIRVDRIETDAGLRLEVGQLAVAAVDALSGGRSLNDPEQARRIGQGLTRVVDQLGLGEVLGAYRDPEGESFKRILNSAHLRYLDDAKARLDDITSLPGPVYLSGLSVGGSVALGLGALDGGERIRGIVAHAPFLAAKGALAQMAIKLVGPLDKKNMRFVPTSPEFAIASLSTHHALGAWITRPEQLERLARIPTLIVMTEADNAADNPTVLELTEKLNARAGKPHVTYTYPTASDVGHALTDPANYPETPIPAAQGGGTNQHWRTLYQEAYRFYTTGVALPERLGAVEQDSRLPAVVGTGR